jgi:nucleoside-diphosphate-sugar epimerase
MSNLRALVTGANGFLGSYLVAELRRRGWSVICISHRLVTSPDPEIICLNGDLYLPESLKYSRETLGPVGAVFHLAAQLPGTESTTLDYLKANTLATAALLESFVKLEAPVFVFASGLTVIGKPEKLPITEKHPTKPLHPYLVSKLAAELLCEQVRLSGNKRIVSLRITSPYGPWMRETTVLSRFVKLALASEDITLYGSGRRTQNFVHASDVVNAFILAAESKASGVYNIGGASSISMRDLAGLILKLLPESRSKVVFSDTPDPQEDYRWEIDLTEAKRELGYVPKVSLEDGIKDYIAFMQSRNQPVRWWVQK